MQIITYRLIINYPGTVDFNNRETGGQHFMQTAALTSGTTWDGVLPSRVHCEMHYIIRELSVQMFNVCTMVRKQINPASPASTFTSLLHFSPCKFIATPTDGVFNMHRSNTYADCIKSREGKGPSTVVKVLDSICIGQGSLETQNQQINHKYIFDLFQGISSCDYGLLASVKSAGLVRQELTL